ncbi:hypothetical protein [Clostridium sp.]|uniref:hypothetical protein n=1 Tax=Clostridium sp. TaxID=1506 RepID=UPI003463E73B
MIRIKLQDNKKEGIVFKIKIKDKDKENLIIRRALFEGKEVRGIYNYSLPVKFFLPIFNNLPKDEVVIDKKSVTEYLEFSDEYDENYFYSKEANAKYMRKWREFNCPNIYKITIDYDKNIINKHIAFQKFNISVDNI